MKTTISVGVFCLLFAGAVYAQCTSNRVVTPEGKVVIWQMTTLKGIAPPFAINTLYTGERNET
jgi:hypothetical protein